MAHDVFVSYSNKDKPVADAAVAALERRGIRCWIAPRDILPGMDWSEALIEAINACRVMLLVFSQNANESHQIKREVERAVAKGVPVIPLRIQDVPLAKSLEYFISMPHWIDALTPERQQDLEYLAETVQLLLERQGRPRAPQPLPIPPQRVDEMPAAPPPRAPEPPPREAPRATRPNPALVAGGTIAAVAIVALVVWLIRRPGPPEPGPGPAPAPIQASGSSGPQGATGRAERTRPSPSPAPAPAPAQQGPVDSRLVGTWDATVTANHVSTQQRMQVGADGRTAWDAVLNDSGAMQAGRGVIGQVSRTFGAGQQRYAFKGADVVTIAGPAGTADWRRTRPGAGGSATFDPALSGTWESVTKDPEGHDVRSTWEISPTGQYTFRAAVHDDAMMRTTGSRWTVTSLLYGITRSGDIQFKGTDTAIIRDDTTGITSTWKRRS